jgi:hypothetical protein
MAMVDGDTAVDEKTAAVIAADAEQSGAEADEAQDEAQDAGAEPAETDQQGELAADEAEPLESLLVDVEYEGRTYQVPREISEAVMRDTDYRRQVSELDEQRQRTESVRARLEENLAMTAAEIEAVSEIRALEAQLAPYRDIDWRTLDANDPDTVQARWEYDELRRQHTDKQSRLREHYALKSEKMQQEYQRQTAETEQQLGKLIGGWSPAMRSDLAQFARVSGINDDALKYATAQEWKILHLAKIGADYQARQRAAAAQKKAQKTQPAREIGTAAAAARNPASMSDDEWMRMREAQLRKRAS